MIKRKFDSKDAKALKDYTTLENKIKEVSIST